MRSPADIIEALRREAQENNQGDLMIAAADEIDDLCGKLGRQDVAALQLWCALKEALAIIDSMPRILVFTDEARLATIERLRKLADK
jgi:hypothetical protein